MTLITEDIVRTYVRKILIEGKVDDIAQKYNLSVDDVKHLSTLDPTPQKKYLQWIVKQIIERNEDETNIGQLIATFHNESSKLNLKDINQYKSIDELSKALDDIKDVVSSTQKRRSDKLMGAERIYEDDDVIVIYIKNVAAAKQYGRETTWCISGSGGDSYFKNYTNNDNAVFYFAMKKRLLNDRFDKLAFLVKRSDHDEITDIEIYDSEDTIRDENDVEITELDLNIGNVLSAIRRDVQQREPTLRAKLITGRINDEELISIFEKTIKDSSLADHMKFFALIKDIKQRVMLGHHITNNDFIKLVDNDLGNKELTIYDDSADDMDGWAMIWRKNGVLHRDDDKPALIGGESNDDRLLMKWAKNGKLHRESGPAVIHPNGDVEWYINDKRVNADDIDDIEF